MLFIRKRGSGSNVLRFVLRHALTNEGLTDLTFASAGLRISTIADVEGSPTDYTAAGGTIESISAVGTFAAPSPSSCRFKQVNKVSQPGLYELQLDNGRYSAHPSRMLSICISGAENLKPTYVFVQLTGGVDLDDLQRGGMTDINSIVTVTGKLNAMIEQPSPGLYVFTTQALQNGPVAGNLTVEMVESHS